MYGIETYADDTFFTSLFASFTSCWTLIMSFIQNNSWIMMCVGVPLVLGLAGAVISFIKGRV